MKEAILKLLFLIPLITPLFCDTLALADATTEGWSWGVGCDGEGTFGTSAFTASDLFGMVDNGSIVFLPLPLRMLGSNVLP